MSSKDQINPLKYLLNLAENIITPALWFIDEERLTTDHINIFYS